MRNAGRPKVSHSRPTINGCASSKTHSSFSETEDQDLAITDVKRDMESSQPMDRLLCGDVGYGKTEIAMRAAFKAVNDNKQVAVLAPTTVLAFQHFETFKQRFAAFPVKIEMISRFRSAKQQKEILQKVEAGKIDILIGTHRLLSKDIKFPDLGLLIVDEEQRFGVRHKERLKQMRKEVDVLTMSATPIPRTLHMSLVGMRDMSVIETPPKDRIAIQTVVASWDEKLIRSSLEQELARGGQVYFVHNRVESIWEIAAKLPELVPKARIIVGHGQMSEGELEKVMLEVHASRSRYSGGYDHYREWPRYSALQYDHHQSRRSIWVVRTVSTAWTRGPVESQGVFVSPHSGGCRTYSDRAPTPRGV